MAITLSTGAGASIASTYGTPYTTTAITNVSNAVVTTSSAHGYSPGDYIEITSGWGLLNNRVVRCFTGTTGSTIVLEGVDTSDTSASKYPAGTGVGSVRKVTAWTALSQIKAVSASGGSQNYADITAVTDFVQKQIPTTRAPVTMSLDIFDDPNLSWYSAVTTADAARTPYALLMTFPNNSKLVANAYWTLMKVPTITTNEALMTKVDLSYAAEPMRYAT